MDSFIPAASLSGQAAFVFDPPPDNSVALTPEVEELLSHNAAVAVGISGGKDSMACALAVKEHLDDVGYTGPRVLVHASLGAIEWPGVIEQCETLARHLGWELLIVRRNGGGLIERWQTRWESNVRRYAALERMKIILPWSSPSLRFCTSELKNSPIFSALRKRFPQHDILNVTGIRHQESASRSRMPISQPIPQLSTRGRKAVAWNAIAPWLLPDVFEYIRRSDLALHPAYTQYGSSRLSCAFCIMSSLNDMQAAIRCESNHDAYRSLVELEAISSFSFQGSRWLGDLAPHLLTDELNLRLARAKEIAKLRDQAESRIPKHLLYVKGWPTVMPTAHEVSVVAEVRREVASLLGLEIGYRDADSVMKRFAELMALKAQK